MCTHSPEDWPHPGLHPRQRGQQVKGEDSAPLLRSGESPPLESCIQLRSPQHRKDMELLERGQGRPQRWSKGWSTSAVRTGCLEKRRLRGGLRAAFQYLKGAYRKDGDNLFSRACCDRRRSNGFTLREGSFWLDIRKKFFTMRAAKHWNRLPTEVVEAPSLETCKIRLDRALSNLIWLRTPPLSAGGLG